MTTTNQTNTAPTTAIDKLHERVDGMYRSGKNPVNTLQLNSEIDRIANVAGIRVEGWKTLNTHTDAVLRTVQKRMMGSKDFGRSTQYTTMVAAAIVKGFVAQSNAPDSQKMLAEQRIDNAISSELSHSRDWQKLYENTSKELPQAKEKFLGGGMVVGKAGQAVVCVGALYGIIKSIKAAFKPKLTYNEMGQPEEKKPGFWSALGKLALAGGIAYVGYNVGWKGKSFGQTFADTRSWGERILAERKNAPAVSFSPTV